MTIYRALFMRHLGMSTKQTGMIWTLEPVVSVLSPPFIGALTDKTRRPKAVLIVLYILGSITFSIMYFVPQETMIPSGIGLNVTVAGKQIHLLSHHVEVVISKSKIMHSFVR